MGIGMLLKSRIVGPAMRCFGLIAVANLKCGRLMHQATTSRRLLLTYGNMRIRSKLISMGMAPRFKRQ